MKLFPSLVARCAILIAAGAFTHTAHARVVYKINIANLPLGQTYNSQNEAAFNQSNNPNLQGQSSGDHLKAVSHPTLSGKKALEFLVQKSTNPTHKGRSEVASPYNLGASADYYLGFRIFFPSDFPSNAQNFIIIQGGNSTNHPLVSVSIANDVIRFPGYSMTLQRNRWYKMEYRIKMGTTASTGKFQVWVDNVQRSDVSMQTSQAESSDPQSREYIYKLGMYAWNWNFAPNEGPNKYRYLVDHLALATTRAEAEAPPAPSTPSTPRLLADTYVRNGASQNINYGAAPQLLVKNAVEDYSRLAYLKFTLPAISGTVASAKLRLYGAKNGGSSAGTTAYGVSNTTWTESGLTWANRPTLGTTQGTTITTTTTGWYEFDVKNWVTTSKTNGATEICLAVRMDSASDQFDAFNSKEAGSNAPQLVITSN